MIFEFVACWASSVLVWILARNATYMALRPSLRLEAATLRSCSSVMMEALEVDLILQLR